MLVVTDDAPAEVVPACVAGAAFSGAHLVVLVSADRPLPDGLPPEAMALAAPDVADDGAFAALVGAYAAALDSGGEPAEAFQAATGETGWAGQRHPGRPEAPAVPHGPGSGPVRARTRNQDEWATRQVSARHRVKATFGPRCCRGPSGSY